MVGDNVRLGNDNTPCHGSGYPYTWAICWSGSRVISGLEKRNKGTVPMKSITSDDPYDFQASRELNTFTSIILGCSSITSSIPSCFLGENMTGRDVSVTTPKAETELRQFTSREICDGGVEGAG